MILRHLTLSNFRLFTSISFSFNSPLTIIEGQNASGKTTILEAIRLLSTGSGFRGERDWEMVSFGSEVARVSLEIGEPDEKIIMECVLTRGTVLTIKTPYKKTTVNGVAKRASDVVGLIKTVLFWPEDLELVTDSPGHRRRYLDSVLSQLDREYHRSLVSYERGVRQRNKVLEHIRDTGADRSQLVFWDQLLIKTGSYLSLKRSEFIAFVNTFRPDSLKNDVKFSLTYDQSLISQERFYQYKDAEVASATTLVGPHRDDFVFMMSTPAHESKELKLYGSRGQQRLAILWLKLAELSYIESQSHQKVVLLLDDIFSELDKSHRQTVLSLITSHQSIITMLPGSLSLSPLAIQPQTISLEPVKRN